MLCTIHFCIVGSRLSGRLGVFSKTPACIATRLEPYGTDVRVQRSVMSIKNCWSSDKSSRVRKTSRVRYIVSHQESVINTFDQTQNKSGSGARVTIYGMSGTDGPEPTGTDPIDLQLPRGAACSSRVPTTEQVAPQMSTTLVTRLIDTNKIVACDSIPLRQVKFPQMDMVFSRFQYVQSANHSMNA